MLSFVPQHLARYLVALALPIPALAATRGPAHAARGPEDRRVAFHPARRPARGGRGERLDWPSRAGENPDPKLIFGVENVPTDGADKWSLTADGMTMKRIGVMQDFVRGDKRELMSTRAQAEARREAALVDMQASELRREVAMAWLERYYAERSLALVDALVAESGLQIAGTTAQLAAGKMGTADPLMARGPARGARRPPARGRAHGAPDRGAPRALAGRGREAARPRASPTSRSFPRARRGSRRTSRTTRSSPCSRP